MQSGLLVAEYNQIKSSQSECVTTSGLKCLLVSIQLYFPPRLKGLKDFLLVVSCIAVNVSGDRNHRARTRSHSDALILPQYNIVTNSTMVATANFSP